MICVELEMANILEVKTDAIIRFGNQIIIKMDCLPVKTSESVLDIVYLPRKPIVQ